jgi:fumarate hydratase subunit alpha
MREISAEAITECVAALCIKANQTLPEGSGGRLRACAEAEQSELCRDVFNDLLRNLDCANAHHLPICQDTGMAVIFADIGQDLHISGDFTAAVNEGVARGYKRGLLRMSVVEDPLRRVNTENNTPAIVHVRLVPGDKLRICAAPKGFGSENMSRIHMFTPAATAEDVLDFITETVRVAGSNPCPPIVVGVGLGGDFEYSALLAKRALMREVGESNGDAFYAGMEAQALERVNKLGIGACGFGGSITALAVNIEVAATHIAGLPCAVNIGCHVNRHAVAVL